MLLYTIWKGRQRCACFGRARKGLGMTPSAPVGSAPSSAWWATCTRTVHSKGCAQQAGTCAAGWLLPFASSLIPAWTQKSASSPQESTEAAARRKRASGSTAVPFSCCREELRLSSWCRMKFGSFTITSLPKIARLRSETLQSEPARDGRAVSRGPSSL